MIAADTSTWIAFLQGDRGEGTELLDKALQDGRCEWHQLCLQNC